MDSKVVERLWTALENAKTCPNGFSIDCMNPVNGIQTLVVLVMDEHTYKTVVKPALGDRVNESKS